MELLVIASLLFYKNKKYNKKKIENIQRGNDSISYNLLVENYNLLDKTNKRIINFDKDAEFRDLNRELKGIATNIVVNDIIF